MKRLLSVASGLAAAIPLGLWTATPSGAEPGVQISPGDSRPQSPGPTQTFTGEVSVTPLFEPNGVRDFSAAEVSFTPCARTAWHTHPGGQTLVVTEGSGWVQEWGGLKQQINVGDVIWTAPDVKHWHGAGEDSSMAHIAVQTFVDGTPVAWMEHVTDEQYRG